MIRVPLLAACVLLSCAPALAQEWADKMFDHRDCDFGHVARGAQVEHRFVFENLYKEDVHIAGVRSSCGCTEPRVTRETLKTHERSEIVARFNTDTFLGERSATLTVTFDQPFHAEVQLHVRGYIRSDVVFEPGLLDFGSVDLGQTGEQAVEITYAGRSTWKIREARCGSSYLSAQVEEVSRANGRVVYRLQATLSPDAPAGFFRDEITLVTNDESAPEVALAAQGRIVAPLTASPSSLLLGVCEPGETLTKQVVIKGREAFRIVRVECEDPDFTFRVPETSKPVQIVQITFAAGEQAGKLSRTVRVYTDLGEEFSIEFSVHAQVVSSETAGN